MNEQKKIAEVFKNTSGNWHARITWPASIKNLGDGAVLVEVMGCDKMKDAIRKGHQLAKKLGWKIGPFIKVS